MASTDAPSAIHQPLMLDEAGDALQTYPKLQYESYFESLLSQNDLSEKERATAKDWLSRRKATNSITTYDNDHTLSENGVPLNDELTLNIPAFYDEATKESVDLNNMDHLLLQVLFGDGINFSTGKDIAFWPMATYLQRRMAEIAEAIEHHPMFHKTDNASKFEDGRPKTYKVSETGQIEIVDKPAFLAITTGNGGYSIDLLGGQVILHKPIPLAAWEQLQKYGELLRTSSNQERINQLSTKRLPFKDVGGNPITAWRQPPRVPYNAKEDEKYLKMPENLRTNQIHRPKFAKIVTRGQLSREIEPELNELEEAHRMRLQADIRDFMDFVGPISTKANLVINQELVIQHQKEWFAASGVLVDDEETFFEAFEKLFGEYVNFFKSTAQGKVFLDLAGPGIDKKTSARIVKNFYQGLLRIYYYESHGIQPTISQNEIDPDPNPEILIGVLDVKTMAVADQSGPNRNDTPMTVASTGGQVVKEAHPLAKNKTLELNKIYPHENELLVTRDYMHEQILDRVPPKHRNTMEAFISSLLEQRKLRDLANIEPVT